jgi:hypothetical protein
MSAARATTRIAIGTTIPDAALQNLLRFYPSFTNLDYDRNMDRNPDDPRPALEPGHDLTPRRARRIEGGGQASLAVENSGGIAVTVRNMSSAGFMAECAEPVRIGSYINLDIPGIGTVEAQVRWQIGRRLGGMFLDPITLARCEWTGEKAPA